VRVGEVRKLDAEVHMNARVAVTRRSHGEPEQVVDSRLRHPWHALPAAAHDPPIGDAIDDRFQLTPLRRVADTGDDDRAAHHDQADHGSDEGEDRLMGQRLRDDGDDQRDDRHKQAARDPRLADA
jgi:hypothetical protein